MAKLEEWNQVGEVVTVEEVVALALEEAVVEEVVVEEAVALLL